MDGVQLAATQQQRRAWYHPAGVWHAFAVRPKILVALGVGIAAFLLLPGWLPAPVRATLAWDLGALVYLTAAAWIMSGSNAESMRKRAEDHDESAVVIPLIVAAAIAASFLAVAGVLSEAKAAGDGKAAYLLLAGGTIVISWAVMQVVFAIHYAHEFYAPRGKDRAGHCLGFAGEGDPDYWDCLYFATTVGATSQTSDTEVRTHAMRRLVTLHSVIAFFFNTIVLALTINIAAGLI